MIRVDVQSVVQSSTDPNLEWGHHIDSPRAPEGCFDATLEIRGWTLPRTGASRGVEAVEGGRVLQNIPVDERRDDVLAAFPQAAGILRPGFFGSVSTAELPDDFELRLYSVLDTGERLLIGFVKGRRVTPKADEGCLRPLLVNSLGRTGTTWMMRLLSTHPRIVVHRQYPYETRAALYWAHLADVLTRPADPERSTDPDNFAYSPFRAGHHPDYQPATLPPPVRFWFQSDYGDDVRRFCRQSTESFYRHVASWQQQDGPAYFCEKVNPGRPSRLFRHLFGGDFKEVFLIRDPRDMFCSMRAFNQKRGFNGFGRERVKDDEDFIRLLGRSLRQLITDWRVRSPAAHLVRYEDLIADPRTALEGILRYAGLESDETAISRMIDAASACSSELEAHRTTPGPSESVGRWRRELPPELQAACNHTFHRLLSEFGYA